MKYVTNVRGHEGKLPFNTAIRCIYNDAYNVFEINYIIYAFTWTFYMHALYFLLHILL